MAMKDSKSVVALSAGARRRLSSMIVAILAAATVWSSSCSASYASGNSATALSSRSEIVEVASVGSKKLVHLHGVVNGVDPAMHTIDIVGLPFWEFVWRQYARNRTVAPDIDLSTIKPGARVDFALSHDSAGTYVVSRLKIRAND